MPCWRHLRMHPERGMLLMLFQSPQVVRQLFYASPRLDRPCWQANSPGGAWFLVPYEYQLTDLQWAVRALVMSLLESADYSGYALVQSKIPGKTMPLAGTTVPPAKRVIPPE